MARVSTRVLDPSRLPIGDTDVGRPVKGNTAAAYAETAVSLMGWSFLRQVPCMGLHAVPVGRAAPVTTETGMLRLARWRTSPVARYIYVGLWVYADAPAAQTVVVRDVQLDIHRVVGGALVDGPVHFTHNLGAQGHGSLPLRDDPAAYLGGALFPPPFDSEAAFLHTGWEPPADLTWTGPRMFDLGTLAASTDVELRATATGVRIYCSTVFEAHQEVL